MHDEQPQADEDATLPRQSPGRIAAVLAVAALVPLVPFAIIGELPGDRWLEAGPQDSWRFGLSAAALLSADVLLPIPSSIVGAMLGGRLGALPGFAWAFAGLMIGHVIGYGLGRLAPQRWGGTAGVGPTAVVVFLSRPVPVLAEAVTLAAGVHRAPPLPFVGALCAGNAIYAAAMAAHGAAFLPQGLAGPGLVVPMLVPVAGWVLWRRLRSDAQLH